MHTVGPQQGRMLLGSPASSCPRLLSLGAPPGPSRFPTRGAGVLWDALSNTGQAGGLRAKAQEITADGGGGGVLPPPRSPLPSLCQAQPRTCWLRPTPSAYLGPLCSFASTGLSSFLPALPPPGHPSSLLPQESAQGPPGSALPRLHLCPAQSPALNVGRVPSGLCLPAVPAAPPPQPGDLAPCTCLAYFAVAPPVCGAHSHLPDTGRLLLLSSEGDLTAPPPHAARPFLLCDTCCILPAHPAHGCSLSVSPAGLGAHKGRGFALLCSLPKIDNDT